MTIYSRLDFNEETAEKVDSALETVKEASRPQALEKLDNHLLALALYFMQYKFARPHKTPAYLSPRTPAMAAGLANHIGAIEELVALSTS